VPHRILTMPPFPSVQYSMSRSVPPGFLISPTETKSPHSSQSRCAPWRRAKSTLIRPAIDTIYREKGTNRQRQAQEAFPKFSGWHLLGRRINDLKLSYAAFLTRGFFGGVSSSAIATRAAGTSR
jgi:hypothetical protein